MLLLFKSEEEGISCGETCPNPEQEAPLTKIPYRILKKLYSY